MRLPNGEKMNKNNINIILQSPIILLTLFSCLFFVFADMAISPLLGMFVLLLILLSIVAKDNWKIFLQSSNSYFQCL